MAFRHAQELGSFDEIKAKLDKCAEEIASSAAKAVNIAPESNAGVVRRRGCRGRTYGQVPVSSRRSSLRRTSSSCCGEPGAFKDFMEELLGLEQAANEKLLRVQELGRNRGPAPQEALTATCRRSAGKIKKLRGPVLTAYGKKMPAPESQQRSSCRTPDRESRRSGLMSRPEFESILCGNFPEHSSSLRRSLRKSTR